MEVPDFLRNAVTRFPERTCVVEGARSRTFAEVDERASRAAAALRGLGLHPGERVALLAYNEIEYLEIQLAVQRAGLVLVPLNYRLALPELEYIVSDCAPRLLVHGPGLGEVAARLGVERTWHLGATGSGESYDEAVAAAEPGPDAGFVPAGQASAILYTSGTTGRPKGAIISCGALFARLNIMAAEAPMGMGRM